MIENLFYVDGVLSMEAVVWFAYLVIGVGVFLGVSSVMMYWDPADVFMAMGLGFFAGIFWGILLALGILYFFPWTGAKLLHARDRWRLS